MPPSRPALLPGLDHELAAGLPSPILVVDVAAADRNIARAVSAVKGSGIMLRPHFKAHKCTTLLARQVAGGGTSGVTCATAEEALVVAEAGIADVLVANQVVAEPSLRALAAAAKRTAVTVAVDDPVHVERLAVLAGEQGAELGVLIEIETGMQRCGVEAGSPALVALAERVHAAPGLRLLGLQAYTGHASLEPDAGLRAERVAGGAQAIRRSREALEGAGLPCEVVSGGGTGSLVFDLEAAVLTELQIGSYVLMDAVYDRLGLAFEQAVYGLATVISTPAPDRAVLDAGHKTLSIDQGRPVVSGLDAEIARLSDEHAVMVHREGSRVAVGDRILLIPSHVDPTLALHPAVLAVGDGAEPAWWPVDGRRLAPAG